LRISADCFYDDHLHETSLSSLLVWEVKCTTSSQIGGFHPLLSFQCVVVLVI